MARKEYIGTFEMPPDLEKAAFDFCKALRRNGYDFGSVTSTGGVVESVHLFKWLDEGTDEISVDYGIEGTWNQYVWGDER